MVVAVRTLERFFPRVSEDVGPKTADITKRRSTVRALVWFFASVDPLVLVQVAVAGKLLAAVGTRIWSLTRVNAHVHILGPSLAKLFTALFARERLFPGMQAHVDS